MTCETKANQGLFHIVCEVARVHIQPSLLKNTSKCAALLLRNLGSAQQNKATRVSDTLSYCL